MQRQLYIMQGVLVFSTCIYIAVQGSGDIERQNYCEFDNVFNPQCGTHEVIIIKHARYGRMREGRCIPVSFGVLGCSMDARGILAGKCSGKPSCEVMITSIPPKIDPPCPIALRGYLEAAYECVSVVYPPRGYCRSDEVTEIQDQHGYLSSMVAAETGCGSSESPWWISTKPGQQIRFSLMEFSDTAPSSSNEDVYTVVKENDPKVTQSLTTRNSMFTSSSNRVQLTLINTNANIGDFLVKYDVIGCPDIPIPLNSWIRRDGMEMTVGCLYGKDQTVEWKMSCLENKWVGDGQECPEDQISHDERQADIPVQAEEANGETFLSESNVLIIMVIVGVVIIVGVCLLVLGLVYICRQWKRSRRSPESIHKRREERTIRTTRQPLVQPGVQDEYYCPSECDYYKTWDKNQPRVARYGGPARGPATRPPLPPPPYSPSRPLSNGSTSQWNGSDTDHIYERPMLLMAHKENGPQDDTRNMDAKYKSLKVESEDSDHMNTV